MNFQAHLESAFYMLKRFPLALILGGLAVQLLSGFTLAILLGPLMGAFLLSVLLFYREKREPSLNDVFKGFERFGELFPYILLFLLTILGFFFLIIPGILFSVWWIYTLPLMADKRMRLGEAMRESYDKVREKGFFMHLVFLFMVYVLPSLLLNLLPNPLGLLLNLILLFPFQVGCLASLYLEQFEGVDPAERTTQLNKLPLS
jgi:hypothetical protein